MEMQKRINWSLVTAILNLIAGVVYVLVKFVIPQIELTGGLSQPARGFSGFMLVVFSCFALGLTVLNLITLAYLNREGKKVKGAVIGSISHTFSFFAIGAFYGLPSFILCLISSLLLFKPKEY